LSKKQTKQVSLSSMSPAQIADMLGELSRKDAKLKSLIAQVDGGYALTIKEAHSPFEAIAESIIYQQLTGKAAATILGRFIALFGKAPFPTPEQIVATPDTVMRSAGLSGAKTVALKDLAAKTIEGKIPSISEVDQMSDEEIIKCLTAVKGVGTWTAHMFLMFRLGRLDVMPSGDYGVRKGFAITYGDGVTLPSPTELETHAERWRPYRSVGSWFMWRAIEINKLFAVPENKTVVKKIAKSKPETKKSAEKNKPTDKKLSSKPAAPKAVGKKKPTVKPTAERKTTSKTRSPTSTSAKKPAADKRRSTATSAKKPAPKKPSSVSTSAKKPAAKKLAGKSNVVKNGAGKKRASS